MVRQSKASVARLVDLEKRMRKLEAINVSIAYQNALIDHEEEIIELLQQQLRTGTTGTGEPIMLYEHSVYSPEYAKWKESKTGQNTDIINLYLFGGFYEQMFTTISKEKVSIKSRVPYFSKIVRRSGEQVMKLSTGSTETLLNLWINPEVKRVVTEALSV